MLILYLSNRYVKIVDGEMSGGRLVVKNFYEEEDWNGCILNGTITDEEMFIKLLEKIWAKYQIPSRKIHLVVDTSQFHIKILEIPLLKSKKKEEYIKREFADVGRIESPVFQYFTIGEADKQTKREKVFAMEAEETLFQTYVEIFSRAGFDVQSIQSARGAAVALLDFIGVIREENGMIQIVDHMILMNFLIARGEIVFSNRVRLFSEPGTLDYVMEISHSVSTTLQFAHTQQIDEGVLPVKVAGLSEEEFSMYSDVLSGINPDREVGILTPGEHIAFHSGSKNKFNFCVAAVGGILEGRDRKKAVIYKITPEKKEKKAKKVNKKIVAGGIAVGILLFIVLGFGIRIFYLNVKIMDVQEFNQREDVVESCKLYDETKVEKDAAEEFGNTMERLSERILAYPKIDQKTENIVESCAQNNMVEVEISSYNDETGTISFDTSADRVERIHQFANELDKRKIFRDVQYTGYTKTMEGKWTVKVNCIMAERQEN
ncbi:MAG: hypothetical protein MR867_03280 [Eubacterium sp.]|nr:hypothetical protein [Eubacterium sp.]